MGITAREGGTIKLIPEELYEAVCGSVIDLGTHEDTTYGKRQRKVMIGFEIPSLTFKTDNGEEPRVIGKAYTLSLRDKANLRKDLESWRGKKFTDDELLGFDLKKIIGVSAQIQVIHNTTKKGKKYAWISTLMKCKVALKLQREAQYFSFEDSMTAIPGNIPEWIVKIIQSSDEYTAMTAADQAPAPEEQQDASQNNDDIPF